MNQAELNNMWQYYLSIERDLSETSRYIEPEGQEDVHSFEFARILVLTCTEIESVFKQLGQIGSGRKPGNMEDYKAQTLKMYPRIVDASVFIGRWNRQIQPFKGWDCGSLPWWKAYNSIKHDRGENFSQATYKNAAYSVGALYLLLAYLASATKMKLDIYEATYISSNYAPEFFLGRAPEPLPGTNEYL